MILYHMCSLIAIDFKKNTAKKRCENEGSETPTLEDPSGTLNPVGCFASFCSFLSAV